MKQDFETLFKLLTDSSPFPWQVALYDQLRSSADVRALDLPTGLGKTSIIPICLIARANVAALPQQLLELAIVKPS